MKAAEFFRRRIWKSDGNMKAAVINGYVYNFYAIRFSAGGAPLNFCKSCPEGLEDEEVWVEFQRDHPLEHLLEVINHGTSTPPRDLLKLRPDSSSPSYYVDGLNSWQFLTGSLDISFRELPLLDVLSTEQQWDYVRSSVEGCFIIVKGSQWDRNLMTWPMSIVMDHDELNGDWDMSLNIYLHGTPVDVKLYENKLIPDEVKLLPMKFTTPDWEIRLLQRDERLQLEDFCV